MKKIILILSVVIVVALSVLVLKKNQNSDINSLSILANVPQQVELIIYFEDFKNILIKLEENSAIWTEIQYDKQVQLAFNLYKKASSVYQLDELEQAVFTKIKNGENSDWLIIAPSSERRSGQKSIIKKYKDIEYDEFVVSSSKIYQFSYNGVTYFSSSMLSIQEAINSVWNETYFSYSENNLNVQRLSGADFYLITKSNSNSYQESDGFVKRSSVEVISAVEEKSESSLRLWEKLPSNYLCEFELIAFDSTQQTGVLTGEFAKIESKKNQQALLLGLSKSLKYSVISDQIIFDSLISQRLVIEKQTIKKMMGDLIDISTLSDTLYGIEDVDFALFSSSKEDLNALYFQMKKNENVNSNSSIENLVSLSRKTWNDEVNLIVEHKKYKSNSNQLLLKSTLKKPYVVDEIQKEYLWKKKFPFGVRTLFSIKNHRTNVNEILVQDKQNTLHLLDLNGEIRWSISLGEEIIGGISQVDVFKNGKLQILFNTTSELYLIDILGRNLDGFPIKLSFEATNQAMALDYENTKDYRILLATRKGILNYNIEGRKVKGFSFSQPNLNVNNPIRHFAIGGLDYICFNDSKGRAYYLNRKGEERFKTEVLYSSADIFNSFKKSSSMQLSKIYMLNLDGMLVERNLSSQSSLVVKDSSILTMLSVSNISRSKRYFVGLGDRFLNIYTPSGNLIREITCDFEPKNIQAEIINGQEGRLLILSKTNELYTFDLYKDKFTDVFHNVTANQIVKDFDMDGLMDGVYVQNESQIIFQNLK